MCAGSRRRQTGEGIRLQQPARPALPPACPALRWHESRHCFDMQRLRCIWRYAGKHSRAMHAAACGTFTTANLAHYLPRPPLAGACGTWRCSGCAATSPTLTWRRWAGAQAVVPASGQQGKHCEQPTLTWRRWVHQVYAGCDGLLEGRRRAHALCAAILRLDGCWRVKVAARCTLQTTC